MTKSEFERRASEMRERNQQKRRFRTLPPPRSIFAPPRAVQHPVKVWVRDFLRTSDIDHLSAPVRAIKKLDRLETDRDGLLDLAPAGFRISVSPELLLRAINAYDAVLKAATERGWSIQSDEGVVLRLVISGEPLELAVAEKTEPVSGITVRPGERRPRKPAGALVATLTAGYQKAMISDKRGTRIESKVPDLLFRAEALASEIHAAHERIAATKRQEELEHQGRRDLEKRIKQLNRDVRAWRRAEHIRAYVDAVEKRRSEPGSIPSECADARWLEWARRYADSIDPTSRHQQGSCRP